MKFLLTLFVALLAMPALAAPVIGETAPAFTATDSNGVTHSLSDFEGKTVVLEWTNHDCPFVQKHYETGNMQALQAKYTAQDVIWLTVISSAPGKQGHVSGEEANKLTADRNAAPTAVLLDESGDVGRAYDAKTTPHMFVINPEGILVYAGAIDDNDSMRHETVPGANNYVAAALDSVLAGEEVQFASSQAYGCSIKY